MSAPPAGRRREPAHARPVSQVSSAGQPAHKHTTVRRAATSISRPSRAHAAAPARPGRAPLQPAMPPFPAEPPEGPEDGACTPSSGPLLFPRLASGPAVASLRDAAEPLEGTGRRPTEEAAQTMSRKKRRPRFTERARRPSRRARREPAAIQLKSPSEIDALAASGALVADCFALLAQEIRPGVRLDALDAQVEALIRDKGAAPLYKGYRGNPPSHPPFPGVICASVNQEICHGLPDARSLAEGDIIGIDIGLTLEGWCGDACVTFAVGEVAEEATRLMHAAETALYRGVAAARIGTTLAELGGAVQDHAEAQGYSVVREWGGHGVGRSLHEPPSIPHTREPQATLALREGMVFTIEPMINAGAPDCRLLDDGWTVVTADGTLSAQYEHTVAITSDGPRILTPWHEALEREIGPASAT